MTSRLIVDVLVGLALAPAGGVSLGASQPPKGAAFIHGGHFEVGDLTWDEDCLRTGSTTGWVTGTSAVSITDSSRDSFTSTNGVSHALASAGSPLPLAVVPLSGQMALWSRLDSLQSGFANAPVYGGPQMLPRRSRGWELLYLTGSFDYVTSASMDPDFGPPPGEGGPDCGSYDRDPSSGSSIDKARLRVVANCCWAVDDPCDAILTGKFYTTYTFNGTDTWQGTLEASGHLTGKLVRSSLFQFPPSKGWVRMWVFYKNISSGSGESWLEYEKSPSAYNRLVNAGKTDVDTTVYKPRQQFNGEFDLVPGNVYEFGIVFQVHVRVPDWTTLIHAAVSDFFEDFGGANRFVRADYIKLWGWNPDEEPVPTGPQTGLYWEPVVTDGICVWWYSEPIDATTGSPLEFVVPDYNQDPLVERIVATPSEDVPGTYLTMSETIGSVPESDPAAPGDNLTQIELTLKDFTSDQLYDVSVEFSIPVVDVWEWMNADTAWIKAYSWNAAGQVWEALTTTMVSEDDTKVLWAASAASLPSKLVITLEVPPDANEPPVAYVSASEYYALPGDIVLFNASESYDPDGVIVSYEWDFDDDGSVDATDVESVWSFTNGRVYTVTVVVTDNGGAKARNFAIVRVPSDIPAVSEWGMVAMALLMLTAGTIVLAGRRPAKEKVSGLIV